MQQIDNSKANKFFINIGVFFLAVGILGLFSGNPPSSLISKGERGSNGKLFTVILAPKGMIVFSY
jgi:hypothetical protein